MILVNFHQWHGLFNYFLFSLSPLTMTKEELKRYDESLEWYTRFASRWVKEIKIKLFLNYLLKLLWLLDGWVRNVFRFSFYCSILIRCIVFTASAKIRERKGNFSPSSFYGLLLDYKSQVLLRLLVTSYKPILLNRWVPLFVSAVPYTQTYTAASGSA